MSEVFTKSNVSLILHNIIILRVRASKDLRSTKHKSIKYFNQKIWESWKSCNMRKHTSCLYWKSGLAWTVKSGLWKNSRTKCWAFINNNFKIVLVSRSLLYTFLFIFLYSDFNDKISLKVLIWVNKFNVPKRFGNHINVAKLDKQCLILY